ncbi:phage tail protein [Paenibacillus cisolokensis]|uniref:Phage tail protein n=1 Tax=Paenibacillus cisolokensis TaxID=1658519 RepID=A0ABQ4N1S4_9BACL|nr:baseplate J/gp47 family protein [Paenibacillus cisolokensis]GIQ62130.1 phage tail protein [Paenibacillus cisolokensis]
MYEHQTYEAILQRMLDRVPDNVDKREGSVIYNACAPAAWELAGMYAELDINRNLSFADTASGEYLTRRCAEFGVNRTPATKARRRGTFRDSAGNPCDVPIGSRFSIGDIDYVAIGKIAAGVYELECEQAGTIGNQLFGPLLPIDYISGLARAELTDIIVPGEDEESDESLRQRYYASVNEPAFGGNIADYIRKVNALNGVGGTKVFPAWQGGGTVKCTIVASDWGVPSPSLVEEVQRVIDPDVGGTGFGTAPIGHKVTIAGAASVTIDVAATVTLDSGVMPGQVQEPIEEVVEAYLLGLRKEWAEQERLIVRVALIEAAILTVPGVIDVAGTTINGAAGNVTLGEEEIPAMGAVTVHV